MRLIFAGSSSFGIPSLQRLMQRDDALLVLSQPDKAAGRHLHLQPCPVAEFARGNGLELFQPEDPNSPESLDRIRSFAPDLIVTASYGALLKRELRNIPALGAVNLHPSLLPKYRGATPIQSALLNGDASTGMTIFRLQARLDAGPVLAQESLAVADNDNFQTLHDKLAELGSWMLAELLPKLQAGTANESAQDDALATYTAKLDKQDTILDWSQPARKVLNKIRALSPSPGAQTYFRAFPFKILAARLTDIPASGDPGSFANLTRNAGFSVNCRDFQLGIQTLQPSGKKAMAAQAFLLGARLGPADRFTNHNQNNNQREEQ